MMSGFFAPAYWLICQIEGIHSDDANDPGGDTWYGISRVAHPDIPWPPTLEQAEALYRSQYYDANRCDEMPWPWAIAVFDCSVNQHGMAVKWAQIALGIPVDGQVGDHTLAAMAAADPDKLRLYLTLRAMGYISRPQFQQDGRGWFKRLFRIAQAGALGADQILAHG